MAGLETSEEDHHLYPGTIIASFIRWTLGIITSIEVNHHTTSIIHTTLDDARVHGQHTPKAPTFRLQPIQPQPNLHEIQLYLAPLLVVPRGRHPLIIVSSTEQASHRSGERKGPPLKGKDFLLGYSTTGQAGYRISLGLQTRGLWCCFYREVKTACSKRLYSGVRHLCWGNLQSSCEDDHD